MKNNQELVTFILMHAEKYSWRAYGLGLLRLDISRELKLHIWNDSLSKIGVTRIHTHPWGFDSIVLCGMMKQRRLERSKLGGQHFTEAIIRCGAGACITSEPKPVMLVPNSEECIRPGQLYSQCSDEIHLSYPEDDTVTLIRRHPFRDTEDKASVFYLAGTSFVSAEPRPATFDEVVHVVSRALVKLKEEIR